VPDILTRMDNRRSWQTRQKVGLGTVRQPLRPRCLAVASLSLLVVLALSCAKRGALYAQPTERIGAGLVPNFGAITDYDVGTLHLGWYCDWRTRVDPARPGGIEFAQLVWVREGKVSPQWDELALAVANNRGSLWMIGNEPENVWQGNNTPEQYAAAYHDVYAFIKQRDWFAQVAIGGVTQPTPLRLEWLDRVLEYYRETYGQDMPVDVWNTHIHIQQELAGGWGCEIPVGLEQSSGRLYTVDDNDNMDVFEELVVAFRSWMQDRGQRNKPLIISECGVLLPPEYGYTPERVNAFMDASFDYLLSAADAELGYPADEHRLVQRWLWYSLNDRPWDEETGQGFNGALFDYEHRGYPGVLTPVGKHFQEYMQDLASSGVPLRTVEPSASSSMRTMPQGLTSSQPVAGLQAGLLIAYVHGREECGP
jgi:hypothetical protein